MSSAWQASHIKILFCPCESDESKNIFIVSCCLSSSSLFNRNVSNSGQHGVCSSTRTKIHSKLSGDQEVPPVTSSAKGWAWVTPGEESGWFKVNVTGIDKVTAAHIHNAKSGENGDVVVTLFKSESPTGPKDGILVEGNFTASNLEGPMKGKELSDLATAMKNGETYVNVHTEANPKGEIRGQLEMGNDDKTS